MNDVIGLATMVFAVILRANLDHYCSLPIRWGVIYLREKKLRIRVMTSDSNRHVATGT
jgi:hypothetical protein